VKEDILPLHMVEPQSGDALRIAIQLDQMKFRQRHFFLFDDLLLAVRELKSGKYKFVHSFNLLRLVVKENISEALPIAPSPSSASSPASSPTESQKPKKIDEPQKDKEEESSHSEVSK